MHSIEGIRMPTYERILVPTDFSEISLTALDHARFLAERFSSTLHLLHVLEDPLAGLDLTEGYSLPNDFLKQLKDRAAARLADLIAPNERVGFHVQWTVREGSPFVEIVRYAREQNVGLIVLGTHGRGPVAHLLLGSVAEQVVRKAHCPVLVTRSQQSSLVLP